MQKYYNHLWDYEKKRLFQKHILSVTKIKRHKHHPILHKVHTKYNISKKTLFYIKEYGPHSHIIKVIIMESIGILAFACLLSSLGGLALEEIKVLFMEIMPLVIMFPTLNNMIGSYGTVISSRFSTLLHQKKVDSEFWRKGLVKMFLQMFLISMITAAMSGGLALLISDYSGHGMNLEYSIKIMMIALIDTGVLITILFLVSVIGGLILFQNEEDPNNFLIPITTSIADFGNMIILAVLMTLFF